MSTKHYDAPALIERGGAVRLTRGELIGALSEIPPLGHPALTQRPA